LVADANGDLFGVTSSGGANGDGAVFELQNTGTVSAPSYAPTPTLLASFDGSNGSTPQGPLVADANGDLFGVTSSGGANGDGAVFELQNTGTVSAPSYASAPTTLFSFDGVDGATPQGGLVIDSSGDLFGVTSSGGANGDGVAFELPPSAVSSPTALLSFDSSNGSSPLAGLYAGPNGGLYGATSAGGANGDGSVFELPTSSLSPSDVLFLELSALAEEFRGGLHGWNALLMEWAIADSASAFQQSQTFVYTGPSAAFSGASQFYGASPSGLADLTSLAKSSVENISPSGSML
ncbi:MAG TPA: choice-of-anchor tandem repeat GloVer-containing protein, partial [Methylocystis sp.]|nr:choice-of-anchor tandem repeat GloVer-containing protein [Methylocystis sp.]